MLCLIRNDGERVIIRCPDGAEITLCVTVQRSRVKLAFDAPRTYEIYREELLEDRPTKAPAPRPFSLRPDGDDKRPA